MKILLLVSGFNGLTQRVWCWLKEQGHEVGVELAPAFATPEELTATVETIDPDLILAPFLKHRVPAEVWERWTTVVIHPGPVGDRGPSSLDHALLDGRPQWGVTALSAVEEMDAGPIWATESFELPSEPSVPLAKSALYNGLVADAAMDCVEEVVRKVAADDVPLPADRCPRAVPDTGELPLLRRTDFAIDWTAPAIDVARRIAAADGAPGAPARVGDASYCLYDAVAVRDEYGAAPGMVVGRDAEAVAIACGRGTVWVGYAATLPGDVARLGQGKRGPKLPAARVLDAGRVPYLAAPAALAETHYERDDQVGYLTLRAYNGAFDTEQCRRLTAAVEKALVEDTRVLVIRGTEHSFSNGIHLGVIDAADDPAAEAWDNIRAIDELCLAIASADQLTVSAYTANAGAGGVMLGLCADIALGREGVVLNPYYDMGIFGSELHTWGLPAKVGQERADELLGAKLPISVTTAAKLGLVAGVGPRELVEFDAWLRAAAHHYAEPDAHARVLAQRPRRRERPLSYHQALELGEMARDLFEDRYGFAAQRRDFVGKAAPTETPAKLRFPAVR